MSSLNNVGALKASQMDPYGFANSSNPILQMLGDPMSSMRPEEKEEVARQLQMQQQVQAAPQSEQMLMAQALRNQHRGQPSG